MKFIFSKNTIAYPIIRWYFTVLNDLVLYTWYVNYVICKLEVWTRYNTYAYHLHESDADKKKIKYVHSNNFCTLVVGEVALTAG